MCRLRRLFSRFLSLLEGFPNRVLGLDDFLLLSRSCSKPPSRDERNDADQNFFPVSHGAIFFFTVATMVALSAAPLAPAAAPIEVSEIPKPIPAPTNRARSRTPVLTHESAAHLFSVGFSACVIPQVDTALNPAILNNSTSIS